MLSKLQAYKVCFCFLDMLWRKNKVLYSHDLPGLLGSMVLLEDGISLDPVIIQDWNALIDKEFISPEEGYKIVKLFLQSGESEFYYNAETKIIVTKMETDYEMMWNLWEKCIVATSDIK